MKINKDIQRGYSMKRGIRFRHNDKTGIQGENIWRNRTAVSLALYIVVGWIVLRISSQETAQIVWHVHGHGAVTVLNQAILQAYVPLWTQVISWGILSEVAKLAYARWNLPVILLYNGSRMITNLALIRFLAEEDLFQARFWQQIYSLRPGILPTPMRLERYGKHMLVAMLGLGILWACYRMSRQLLELYRDLSDENTRDAVTQADSR